MMKWTERQSTKRILLIDHSASMNTREPNATRLELARQAAQTYIHDLAADDQAMIIAFADRILSNIDQRRRLGLIEMTMMRV